MILKSMIGIEIFSFRIDIFKAICRHKFGEQLKPHIYNGTDLNGN